MHKNVRHLFELSKKESRRIVGLMSGTSLDGLDIAVCLVEGYGTATRVTVEHFLTEPYGAEMKAYVQALFAKKKVDLEFLCLFNAWLGTQYGRMVNENLKHWGLQASDVDLLASHGQTIYHAPWSLHKRPPFESATLQIGDGDHLARTCGIITVSDFRQKHTAAGGEGAPLALYGDVILFRSPLENRVLVNIGGIANFTWLPANGQQGIVSTDCGPGNTLSDGIVRRYIKGESCDVGGALALTGTVIPPLLEALKQDPFFKLPFPKTTGQERFGAEFLNNAIEKWPMEARDLLATVNKFTADAIMESIGKVVPKDTAATLYFSGGGVHNASIMGFIEAQKGIHRTTRFEELGMSPDAKEAVLMAILANETVGGDLSAAQYHLNNAPGVGMGKISFPD